MIGLIIWGSGGDSIDLGTSPQKQYCSCCEQERSFRTLLQYRFAHLYYIFSWTTKKNYYHLCEVCQRGWELNAQEVEKALGKNPIPFLRRSGWMLLAVPVVLIILLGLLPRSSTKPLPRSTTSPQSLLPSHLKLYPSLSAIVPGSEVLLSTTSHPETPSVDYQIQH